MGRKPGEGQIHRPFVNGLYGEDHRFLVRALQARLGTRRGVGRTGRRCVGPYNPFSIESSAFFVYLSRTTEGQRQRKQVGSPEKDRTLRGRTHFSPFHSGKTMV